MWGHKIHIGGKGMLNKVLLYMKRFDKNKYLKRQEIFRIICYFVILK